MRSMVSLKVMSYIIGGSLGDVRLAVASTDALTSGSAAREATGCRRTRSDPARTHAPGDMGRVPQGIATPLIAATPAACGCTRHVRPAHAAVNETFIWRRAQRPRSGQARPSGQRPASVIAGRLGQAPRSLTPPIHLLCTGSAVIIRWSQPPRTAVI